MITLALRRENNEKLTVNLFKEDNFFKNELKIMSELKHENIVSVLGWTRRSTSFGILMDFGEGGTLNNGNHENFFVIFN